LKHKGSDPSNISNRLEDYDVTFKVMDEQNNNYDIWSLGIIILEFYLSVFIYKKDCREMVHNLYLNRMNYTSRCIILNEILEHK